MQETKQTGGGRLLLLLLILIQAAGLALFPFGVRRMVDLGVRQSGIRYATPLQLREQTLEDLRLFLAPGDYKTIHDAYDIENGVCTLRDPADQAALSGLFAPAERLYLRTVQRGGNAMVAARAAMESGAMTQSQLLEQAREGLNELTPAQETMAGVAFLRSEYSVMGTDPNAIRASYLSRWTWILIGCAVVIFLAAGLEERIRRDRKETQIPKGAAMMLAAALAAVPLVWGGVETAAGLWKTGALILAAVALSQIALTFLPAALRRKGTLPKPETGNETMQCVLPGIIGGVGAATAMAGAALASRSAGIVNAGLNRILAGSGGTDGAALLRALGFGALLILAGIALIALSQKLDRDQKYAYPGRVGTVLDILPGAAGMLSGLVIICSHRFLLGMLILLSLPLSVGFMAVIQNRRSMLVETSVHLPGRAALAALAGLGANLAARSDITMSGYLACVLCALVFTRTGAKLLTRR